MKNLFFYFLAIVLLYSCQENSTSASFNKKYDPMITWKVISNQISEDAGFRAEFTFYNRGKETLSGKGWKLYFTQTNRKILNFSGPGKVEMINGDWYRVIPNDEFELAPGAFQTIVYEGEAWMIKEGDAPAGLYFVTEDEAGNELEQIPVKEYVVLPFEKEEQINRHLADKEPIPNEALRYEDNLEAYSNTANAFQGMVPSGYEGSFTGGQFEIPSTFSINYEEGLEKEANYLQNFISQHFKKNWSVQKAASKNQAAGLSLGLKSDDKNSYQLEIDEQGIQILGDDSASVFYGIQSFLQLIPVESFQGGDANISVPTCNFSDAPHFEYRGMHLDVGRNFKSTNAVKKLLDVMAFYKLNKLHMHLTEDEGWRLEIEEIPELTEVGGRRGHTLTEEDMLHPAYGSGNSTDNDQGTGHYSRAEFKELIQYAYDRHIDIIPEINVPGHARAAIKSMESRYKKYMAEGSEEKANEYLLTDFEDESSYLSVQYYPDNVVCPCLESTYTFYETVVEDVVEQYKEAGVPLKILHTGGDEVPAGVWEKSPACAELMNKEGITTAYDLTYYFRDRLSQILQKHDLTMAGWEEIALRKDENGAYQPNKDFVDRGFLPYVWNNLWGMQDLSNRLANADYPVILCQVTHLYFDMAYNKDPQEPGFYWGGFVDTKKAFQFMPFDILGTTTEDAMGTTFDVEEDYKDMEKLKADKRKNIVGIQGQLWTESIMGDDMLEYYYMPKILALADIAWSSSPQKISETGNWANFANTVGKKEMPRLDYLFGGYNYRLPLPGAKIIDGKVVANVAFPGLEIRYETDGREPTINSPIYTEPIPSDKVKLKTFNTKGRSSRTSSIGFSKNKD